MLFFSAFLLILAMVPVKSVKAAAFLDHMFQPIIQKPNLSIAADKQMKKQLKIELSIGKSGTRTMKTPNIKDMIIELHHENFLHDNRNDDDDGSSDEYHHVPLPGADGPNPNLSSGHRRIQLLSRGRISSSNNNIFQLGGGSSSSSTSQQQLEMINGCWEMCWRKDIKKLAGTLVCGFEIPKEYRLGGGGIMGGTVLLPEATKLYISFPLWTSKDLKDCQNKKRRANHWLQKRDEELHKFDLTDNYLIKVLHLTNAFLAVGEYQQQQGQKSHNTHNTALQSIPNSDEVIELQQQKGGGGGMLFLETTGMVWSSSSSSSSVVNDEKSSFRDHDDGTAAEYISGGSRNNHQQHTRALLGVATIVSSS